MKVFAAPLLLAAASTIQAAGIVTCTATGVTVTTVNQPCMIQTNFGPFGYAGVTSEDIAGNTLSFFARAGAGPFPNSPVALPTGAALPATGSATWNDVFNLPASNPNDVLDITAFGGGGAHPGSEIRVGQIDIDYLQFCDAHFIGNPACTFRSTELASQVPGVNLVGMDSIDIGMPCGDNPTCGFGLNGTFFEESVTISRFLSDGVTPDPFTSVPEPRTSALVLLAGLGVCISAGLRVRSARRHHKEKADFVT